MSAAGRYAEVQRERLRYKFLMYSVDFVLKSDYGPHLTKDALQSPNHKKHFNFFLECIQNFQDVRQFWYGRVESGQNGRK